ncbi:TPA: DUF1542 domain-containing protein, partial [Streptococcus suis]|nr:DUF1542 domain-containing protein [Streptococcus suis]
MSSKDMFRKEQRFSFRKFSFGLASAVIANVIFGGAIANTPVVHANTATETAAVATSERIASIPYTVNIVDQAGKVVETKEKKVLVYTVETIATATEYLTADLVPEGYAIVSGLGEVTLTEKAENVFTVKVDKIAPEAVATTTTAESATSETATAAATPEPASLTATQSTPVTSEVAEAEVAPTTSEESAKPTERTVYLSYITHYVNEANETVDRTGHLVAVTTTDDTAKTQVTVSASENMPSGWELVQDKAKVVVQLVENQTNILVFAVTKKSKEEEIAESQLSNRDVLMRLSLEADLLADEALRQVAKEQAGNTALETAANETKAVAATANEVLANDAATETELDDQIDTVRTSTQNLAAEMLKVDKDGILTAQLNTTQVSRPDNYQEIGTEVGAFHPERPDLTRYLFVFGTTEGTTESGANGTLKAAPVANKDDATRALVPAGTITNIVYNDGKTNTSTLGSSLTMDTDGFLKGTFNHTAGGPYTRKLILTTDTGSQTSNEFTVYAYTDKASSDPVEKLEDQALTQDEVFAKMAIATTSTRFQNAGKNIPTVPADEYSRSIVGYRTVTVGEDGSKVKGELVKQEDLTQFPKDKDFEVKVKTTNVYGQTIYNWVKVDYNLRPSISELGTPSNVVAQKPSNKTPNPPQNNIVHIFGITEGTTEAVTGLNDAGEEITEAAKAPKFILTKDSSGAIQQTPLTTINDEDSGQLNLNYTDSNASNYGNLGSSVVVTDQDGVTIGYNGSITDDSGAITNKNLYLGGTFNHGAGGLYSRAIRLTDQNGNSTLSNEVYMVGYTDKLKDNVAVVVDASSDLVAGQSGKAPVAEAVLEKLIIDSTSKFPNSTQPTVTVPETEYTREIVGYRLTGETTVNALSESTLNTLPAGKNYEVRVKTTNKYGQTIYNWVPVNDTRTKEVEKVDTYLFRKTPIQTLDGTNRVKMLTVEDKDGVGSFTFYQSPSNVETAITGIEIAKEDTEISKTDGTKVKGAVAYQTGTPNEEKLGVYRRSVKVTDALGNEEFVAVNVGKDNRHVTRLLDTRFTKDPETNKESNVLKKQAGERPTTEEILAKVEVITGSGTQEVLADKTMYDRVELAPDAKVPTAPGEYDVTVRVVTKSNVYKDVVVKVIIPKYEDVLTATAAENTSLVPGSGTAASQPIVINDANGDATTAPADTTYAIDPAFKAEKEALGYKISVDKNGVVSVEAPKGQEADITVPVTVTYPDKTTDKVSVPFKVDQQGLAQLKAKEALDDEAKAAKEAINNNPNLSTKEKEDAVKAVDTATEAAKKAVNDATTIDAVDAAKEAGTKAIDAKELDAAKLDAKNKIAKDVEAANTAIESNPNLTKDEIDAAKAAVAKAAEDANKAIDAATTPAEAQTAEDNGVKAIDAEELAAAKQDAKNKIAKDVEAANAAIESNPNLTKDEIDAAKAAVADEAKKANDAIDAATTPEAVQAKEEEGTKAIAADVLDAAKQDAKNKIAKDVEAANAAIESNPNLTKDEKDAAKAAVADEAKKANDAIAAATTPEAVQAKEEEGTKEIAADVLDAAKQDAKNKIAKDVEAANAAIESNPNLSEKEIADAKAAVADEAKKANDAIDAATTPEAVQEKEEEGTKAIAADVLDAAKLDAKNKIAKDLATVEAAIDANSNLSDGEKEVAKLAAQAKAAEAVANIEKATTPEAVQTLEDAAVKDLANIEIKAAYDDAVKAIEAADNLSTAAKTKALDDLKKARQAAEDAIKTATTADEVAKGALDGLKSLAKVEAKAAADDAKAAIAQNSNLTDAEKKVYTDAIDKALKDTETKIDAATDADTVDAETVLAQKDIAKQEVAAATADAVKGIEANTNLTDAEKDEYKATVTKAAETAEKAIEDATTAADIQSKTFDATQDVAKEEVKADAADAIAGIKANDNLSDTAKEEAIAAIEEARDTTLENIENAKTAADVDTATLDAEKANAKAEIKAAADDAKKAIDENANLPASDKNALKLAIDAEVAATNLEIDNAKTAEEIDAATLATEKSIAKAEVKAAAEDALQAIDENANLTDDEKA